MRPFSLLVKPASADCNLRCSYCFYLGKCQLYPKTKRHRMSDKVLERMISSFMSIEMPQHSFGWQGGEPTLMGVDFFRRVVDLQKEHGRVVSNGLQTNGTLIDSGFAEHLAKYNFLIGVSVDGPESIHDVSRKTVDERGSHSDVIRGISNLKDNGAEYNVLTLVSQANVAEPVEVYRYLRDELGVLFHQYIDCVEFDGSGALMPFAVNASEWGDFLCAIFDEWIMEDTRKVSVRLFDSIISMMVDNIASSCTMSDKCDQYLVVEHNGDVYPCDFFVEERWRLGNVMTHSWEDMRSSEQYVEFVSRKSQWDEECSGCEYLKYCAGCCPKNRPDRVGDAEKMSVLCEGWKRFYKHSLKSLRKIANQIESERKLASRRRGLPLR